MGEDWVEYQCKSGQTLFNYNKETGEHKWPLGLPEGIEYRIICSRPVEHRQVSTTATQTDDYGCKNGCMSKNLETDQSVVCSTSNAAFPLQQHIGISNEKNSMVFELQAVNVEEHRLEKDRSQSTGMMTANQNNLRDFDNGYTSTYADDQLHNQNPCTVSKINTAQKKSSFALEVIADTTAGSESCNGEDDGCGVCYSDSVVPGSTYDNNIYISNYSLKDNVGNSGHYSGCMKSSNDDGDVDDAEISDNDSTSRDTLKVVYKQDEDIEVLPLEEKEVVIPNTKIDNISQSAVNASLSKKSQRIKKKKTQELHKCYACGKAFKVKISLQRHCYKQTVECKFCMKKFPNKCSLTRHVMTHSGENPFECSYCKKPCGDNSTLAKHIRIHTGEKPFECSLCEKKFSRRGNLNCHVKTTHVGVRSFECTFCTKKFTKKSHLKEHVNIHTGEKPFQCTVCEKRFTHRRTYHRHVSTYSCTKLKCSICKKLFVEKSSFESHLKTHT